MKKFYKINMENFNGLIIFVQQRIYELNLIDKPTDELQVVLLKCNELIKNNRKALKMTKRFGFWDYLKILLLKKIQSERYVSNI